MRRINYSIKTNFNLYFALNDTNASKIKSYALRPVDALVKCDPLMCQVPNFIVAHANLTQAHVLKR